jgi:ArsR family transcriptional regulator, arsenate/arsenite/antimonite-responsive transcriptional repressor
MLKYKVLYLFIVILQYKNIQIMGASKSDSFTKEQNDLSILFKALSHPARIAIIDYLLKVDTCICGDIVNELPLAQPTVSQHLKELKNAGIIKGSIEGTAICYCIDTDALQKFEYYFSNITNQLKNKCC